MNLTGPMNRKIAIFIEVCELQWNSMQLNTENLSHIRKDKL